jgi:chorismate dehydratase
LNAKPLIAGLDTDSRLELIPAVPSRLPELLDRGAVEAALVPVVDVFAREPRWKIVSDACIGCDGETLTVRVFSRVAPEAVRRLAVDADSHTSVLLAQVIWRERFGRVLEIIPLSEAGTLGDCDATLLIGDKVIARPGAPRVDEFTIEMDLGSMWKSLVSLPFVFAVWAAPAGIETTGLGAVLTAARDRGVAAAARIASECGPALGWPVSDAERYLTSRLLYTLGDRQRLGLAKFRELASAYGLLPEPETVVSA